MGNLPPDIAVLVAAEKTLGATPNWDTDSDPRYNLFTYPLTIQGVATGGFQLRLKVSKRWVDRDAVAQLEYAPTRKDCTPLWRMDWKPLKPHTNARLPADHAFDTFDGSHHHTFDDNYLLSEGRMRTGNLHPARPLPNDLNTLSDFLAYVGKLFRIKDVEKINLPASNDMFWAPQ